MKETLKVLAFEALIAFLCAAVIATPFLLQDLAEEQSKNTTVYLCVELYKMGKDSKVCDEALKIEKPAPRSQKRTA